MELTLSENCVSMKSSHDDVSATLPVDKDKVQRFIKRQVGMVIGPRGVAEQSSMYTHTTLFSHTPRLIISIILILSSSCTLFSYSVYYS